MRDPRHAYPDNRQPRRDERRSPFWGDRIEDGRETPHAHHAHRASDEDEPFQSEDEGGLYGNQSGFTPNQNGAPSTNASMGGWYGNQGLGGEGGFQGNQGGYGLQSHLGRPRQYGFHDNYLPEPRHPLHPQNYRGAEHSGLPTDNGWSARRPGMGPKGYKRSDERIREEICEALSDSPLDTRDVEVTVTDGHVTLSGSIRYREDKRRIEDVADRVRGVHDITNQLRVPREQLSSR